jgi:hypothetical protein
VCRIASKRSSPRVDEQISEIAFANRTFSPSHKVCPASRQASSSQRLFKIRTLCITGGKPRFHVWSDEKLIVHTLLRPD